ncbi:MAG: NfeD family protein [Oscillospiraceae bacterium]|nr:NfeD family protein [Oscillospiraceae bacterium]MBR3084648.1 NfeD family protein [Oscillospiraceae bacterium]MBR3861361.1 NfeD family protein [Oscillospiraceae bacterium]MBR6096367.1 NfeD family protein [Oscillospiraceae bacterium]MBR7055927.1 NfeD family protein [Oscillospiraceae bacterium]
MRYTIQNSLVRREAFDLEILIWAGLTVLFVLVELATYGLASIWFALGALAALIAAALGAPLWLQVVLFAVVSVASLVLTRPLARKFVNSRSQPTNADRVIGAPARVTEEINDFNGTGAVSVDGKLWSARSADGAVVPVGAHVTVREIRGVRLIVSPEPEQNI